MKCPVLYEPGRWALLDVPEKDLQLPAIKIAFRGPDEQVIPGSPRSLHSMVTYEAREFIRIDLVANNEPYHLYLPKGR